MDKKDVFLERLARHRLPLSFLLFVALVTEWLVYDRGRAHALLSFEHPIPSLGILFLLLGLGLRSWAAGVLQKNAALTIVGPYALVRHPLYLGSFLISIGFALQMADWLALAVALTAIPALYAMVIRREERHLADRFGQAWTRYASKTAAWIPQGVRAMRGGPWAVERWWRNREWRVIVQTAAAAAVLEQLNWWTRN